MGAAVSSELPAGVGGGGSVLGVVGKAGAGGLGPRKGGNRRASGKVQPVWEEEGEDEAIERKARQLEQLKDRVNAAIASGSRVKQLMEGEARRNFELAGIRLRFTSNGALEHCSLFSEHGGRHGSNQDSMIAWEDFNVPEIAGRVNRRMPPGAASDVIFCAVFDGHGPNGHLVSQRVRDSLPSRIASLLAPPPVQTVSPYGHLDSCAPLMAPASNQLLQRLGVGASGKVHPLGGALGNVDATGGCCGPVGGGGFGMSLQRSRSADSLVHSSGSAPVGGFKFPPASGTAGGAAAGSEASKAQVERAFRRAFLDIDDELRSHPHIDAQVSGSTAVVAALLGRRLVLASIGDSRAVLAYRCKVGHAIPGDPAAIGGMQCKVLTNDHKCSVASERKRIERAGGRVEASEREPWTPRIWLPRERSPGLVPSRAFGDFVVKDYGVIAEPDILIRHLTSEDEFIILASDGLWDVMTPQEAVSAILAAPSRQTAARHLIAQARSLWAAKHASVKPDDCTAVVLFLPDFAPSGLLSSTLGLPHSGPLSSSSSMPYSGPMSAIPHSAPLTPSLYAGSLSSNQGNPIQQKQPTQQVQMPPRQFLSQLPMPLPSLTSSDIKPATVPDLQARSLGREGSDGGIKGAAEGSGGCGSGMGKRKKSGRKKGSRRELGIMSFMGPVEEGNEEGNEEAFDDAASVGTVYTEASYGTVVALSEADFKLSETTAAAAGELNSRQRVLLTPPICDNGFYRDDTIRLPAEEQNEGRKEGQEKENRDSGNDASRISNSSSTGVAEQQSSSSKELKRSVLGLFYSDGRLGGASAPFSSSKVVPLPLENPPVTITISAPEAKVMAPPMRSRSLMAMPSCMGAGGSTNDDKGTAPGGCMNSGDVHDDSMPSCMGGDGIEIAMHGCLSGGARLADQYFSLGSGERESGSTRGSVGGECERESGSGECGAIAHLAVSRLGLDVLWQKCWRSEP